MAKSLALRAHRVDSERTALLIMDVQPEIVERVGDSGLTERLALPPVAAVPPGCA